MHLNPSDLIAHAPALFDAALKILAALLAPVLTMLVSRRLGTQQATGGSSALPAIPPPVPSPPAKLTSPKNKRRKGRKRR